MPKRGENIYRRQDGRWEGRVKLPDSQKRNHSMVIAIEK